MYVEGGLTVAGTRQFFAGAFKHDGRKGFSKRLVRLFNQGFGDGILVIQIFAHAYFWAPCPENNNTASIVKAGL